jgi:hypothetical protein
MEWIEIPTLAAAGFSMSSLFLGERPAAAVASGNSESGPQPVRVDVDHRFARTSVLRFQTYVYDAARNSGQPDVWIGAQILKGTQAVMVVAPSKIPPDVSKDPGRLPYWSEIALNQLAPGAYTLEVSATDKTGGVTSSQRINFSVE